MKDDVLDTALDEALDKVDFPIDDIDNEEPAEPQLKDDEPEENPTEEPTEEPKEEEPGEPEEEPEAKAPDSELKEFARTGNPNSIKNEDARKRVLSLMGAYTRGQQEIAQLKKDAPAKETQPEAPELDMNADDETLKKQLVDTIKFYANETGRANNAELKETVNSHQDAFNTVERDKMVKEIEDHVRGLPGHTKEIEDKMEQLVVSDPEWSEMLMSPKGRVALFNEAKSQIGVKPPKKGNPGEPRLKTKDAVVVPPKKRYKGMDSKQKYDAAFDDGYELGHS